MELTSVVKLDHKQDEPNKSSERYLNWIRFYLVPLVAVIIFFYILLFVVLPQINALLDGLDEVSATEQERDQLLSDQSRINALLERRSAILQNLEAINQVAPAGNTEVIIFAERVQNIATSRNLTLTSQQTTSVGRAGGLTQRINSPISLLEVTVAFEVQGNFRNISNFIDDISALDDFIIINDYELTGSVADDSWSFNVVFSKYQFVEDETRSSEVYRSIRPTETLDPEIEEYLEERL